MTVFKTIWGEMRVPDSHELHVLSWQCYHCSEVMLEGRICANFYTCTCDGCSEQRTIRHEHTLE